MGSCPIFRKGIAGSDFQRPFVGGDRLFQVVGALASDALAVSNCQVVLGPCPLFRKGIAAVRSRPALMSILGIGLIYGLYSEGWDRLWVKFLVDKFTIPSVFGMNEVAFLGLLRAGGMVISILVTRQVEKRLDASHAPSIARAMWGITALLSLAIFAFAAVSLPIDIE